MNKLEDFQKDERLDLVCDEKTLLLNPGVWFELNRKDSNPAYFSAFGKYIYEFDTPKTWRDLVMNADKTVEPPTNLKAVME
jgi:hypothetical protein